MTTKVDNNGPFKEFIFEDWLREGMEGMCNRMKIKKGKFNISDFETHMRNARKEQLLAMRSLVDSFITLVDDKPDEDTK